MVVRKPLELGLCEFNSHLPFHSQKRRIVMKVLGMPDIEVKIMRELMEKEQDHFGDPECAECTGVECKNC